MFNRTPVNRLSVMILGIDPENKKLSFGGISDLFTYKESKTYKAISVYN